MFFYTSFQDEVAKVPQTSRRRVTPVAGASVATFSRSRTHWAHFTGNIHHVVLVYSADAYILTKNEACMHVGLGSYTEAHPE
jgi:hypothetical protein